MKKCCERCDYVKHQDKQYFLVLSFDVELRCCSWDPQLDTGIHQNRAFDHFDQVSCKMMACGLCDMSHLKNEPLSRVNHSWNWCRRRFDRRKKGGKNPYVALDSCIDIDYDSCWSFEHNSDGSTMGTTLMMMAYFDGNEKTRMKKCTSCSVRKEIRNPIWLHVVVGSPVCYQIHSHDAPDDDDVLCLATVTAADEDVTDEADCSCIVDRGFLLLDQLLRIRNQRTQVSLIAPSSCHVESDDPRSSPMVFI